MVNERVFVCSCCGIQTNDCVQGELRKDTDWLLVFRTHNDRTACFCAKCYRDVYADWRLKDEDRK